MLRNIWVSAGTTGGTDNAQSCAAPRRSASHLGPNLIAASVDQQFTTAKVYRV